MGINPLMIPCLDKQIIDRYSGVVATRLRVQETSKLRKVVLTDDTLVNKRYINILHIYVYTYSRTYIYAHVLVY